MDALAYFNIQVDYAYDINSNPIEKAFSTGLKAAYAYNETGLLTELTHTDAEGVLDKLNYSYDNLFRKTAIKQFRCGMPEVSGNYEYSYDALSRLAEVAKDGKQLRTFGYDPFGNRSFMLSQGVRTDYTYNALNQLMRLEGPDATKEFSYDARGNLAQITAAGKPIHTYEYGPLNRLIKATDQAGQVASYFYNGLGHRAGSQIEDALDPTVRIDYLLDLTRRYNNLLQTDDGTRTKSYLWDSGIVAETSDASKLYLTDDLGSPLRFMGADGALADSYAYDEFGADLSGNQGTVQPFGFTGYSFDTTADSYFAQARQYDPLIGRFGAADSHWNTWNMIYGDSGYMLPDIDAIKQSGNLYAYCMSDPLQYVDALGMWGDLHYGVDDPIKKIHFGTIAWAKDVGISSDVATTIAKADKGVDDFINSTNPVWGSPINPITGKPSLKETLTSAGATLLGGLAGTAVAGLGNVGQAYHFNMQNSPRVVADLKAAGVNVNGDTRLALGNYYYNDAIKTGSYEDLGKGLHAIQDIFAHGNKGVPNVDTEGPDGFFASLKIASHKDWFLDDKGKQYDYENYDWADCTLTKVTRVGSKTGERYKDTELASKAYLASGNYEMAHR